MEVKISDRFNIVVHCDPEDISTPMQPNRSLNIFKITVGGFEVSGIDNPDHKEKRDFLGLIEALAWAEIDFQLNDEPKLPFDAGFRLCMAGFFNSGKGE